MAAQHASRHVQKSLRLHSLLRNFSLPHEVMASEDRREIIAAVKQEYFRRAKEQHPDLVPDEQKADASKRFALLHEDFSETTDLLEEGVQPRAVAGTREAVEKAENMYGGSIRQPMYRYPAKAEDYSEGPRYPVPTGPVFDTYTRVKCNIIFWSGFFCFLTFMREFLVWSAGSTYAWSKPADLNPFWIRRFQNDWVKDSAKDRSLPPDKTPGTREYAAKKKAEAKVTKLTATTDRKLDDFYKKRHIRDVKTRYTPRGSGGPQM